MSCLYLKGFQSNPSQPFIEMVRKISKVWMKMSRRDKYLLKAFGYRLCRVSIHSVIPEECNRASMYSLLDSHLMIVRMTDGSG